MVELLIRFYVVAVIQQQQKTDGFVATKFPPCRDEIFHPFVDHCVAVQVCDATNAGPACSCPAHHHP